MESIDFSKFKEFKFIRNKMNIQGKDFVDFGAGYGIIIRDLYN